MNPIENGDIYLTPLNMIDVNEEPVTPSDEEEVNYEKEDEEEDEKEDGVGGGLNENTNTDTQQ